MNLWSLFIGAMGPASYAETVLADAPVLYWSFYETPGAVIYDDSGNVQIARVEIQDALVMYTLMWCVGIFMMWSAWTWIAPLIGAAASSTALQETDASCLSI